MGSLVLRTAPSCATLEKVRAWEAFLRSPLVSICVSSWAPPTIPLVSLPPLASK